MSADELLLEIIGHLGAAKMQRIPSDDEIIGEHIDAAYELAKVARRVLHNSSVPA